MIGGSSRIPTVRQRIKDFFRNAKFDDKVHVEEAIAMGAGMFGESCQIIAITALPTTLGIKRSDGTKIEMIPK